MSKLWYFLTKKRYMNWPYLDLYICLPFLMVRTDVMMQAIERNVFEYIGIYIKVWKWEWTFRVYQPNKERNTKGRA